MSSPRKWFLTMIIICIFILAVTGLSVVIVDPWFHFHKPVEGISYYMDQGNERYQNDGIVKNFDYDSLITGSSMIENTNVSELEKIYGVSCIKVPFAGSYYKETDEIICKALSCNDKVKTVFRGLDYNGIIRDKDATRYADYPEYLYDDNSLNDVSYIFNKRALAFVFGNLLMTIKGEESTTFDEYANKSGTYTYSKEVLDASYNRGEKKQQIIPFTDEDRKKVEENVRQNIICTVEANPDVDFYYFITPYSIYYWDGLYIDGGMERQLEAERYMIELLVEYDNLHLYSFNNAFDKVCDLNEYRDTVHYSDKINSWILSEMKAGNYRITKDNYEAYLNEVGSFYENYDYDKLFED